MNTQVWSGRHPPKEAELELLLRRFSGPTTELSGIASCNLDILAKDIHCKVPFYRHRLTLTVIARYLVSLGLYSRASLHRGIRIVIISVLKTAISESESVLVDFYLDTFPLCNGNDESSSRHRCGTIHFNSHRRNNSEYVPYSLCSQSYPLLLQQCKVHQQTIKCWVRVVLLRMQGPGAENLNFSWRDTLVQSLNVRTSLLVSWKLWQRIYTVRCLLYRRKPLFITIQYLVSLELYSKALFHRDIDIANKRVLRRTIMSTRWNPSCTARLGVKSNIQAVDFLNRRKISVVWEIGGKGHGRTCAKRRGIFSQHQIRFLASSATQQ